MPEVREGAQLRGEDGLPKYRALLTFAGSLSPNTYVVDVDAELGTALVHDLDRRRGRDPL